MSDDGQKDAKELRLLGELSIGVKNPDGTPEQKGAGFGTNATKGNAQRQSADRSGVKRIQDMAAHSHHLPSGQAVRQPVNHVMSDNYIERRRRVRWGVSVTLLIGFIAALVFVPGFSDRMMEYARQGYDQVETLVNPKQQVSAKKKRRVKRKRRNPGVSRPTVVARRPSTSGEKERYFDNPSCAKIVNTRLGFTDYKSMSRSEKILVAECFLLYGQATAAAATIEGFERSIRVAGENKINKDSSPGGLGDAMFAVLDVHLARTNYRAADAMLTRNCRTWRRSNTCVAKLSTLVARKFTNAASNAYKQMVLSGDKINKSAYARYYLAGAQIAGQKGQYTAAAKRYRQALADAPRRSHWLRKRIYESYGLELYRRGEMLELKKLTSKALREFRGVDPNAQVKLLLLADIAKPVTRAGAVTRFLYSQDRAYQARGALEIIEILATEAIRFRKEKEFLKTLKRAKTFFATKYQASSQIMRQLQLWEVRLRISQREYELVFQSLGKYDRDYGKDAVSAHLRGVVYMAFSPNRQYQLLGAKELQSALRKQPNWESLYALGTALVRGGKSREVKSVLMELQREVRLPIQRYWLDMLQAEYFIGSKAAEKSLKILQKWRAKEPEFLMPVQLQVSAYNTLGRADMARRIEITLDSLRARVKVAQSREGQSSPLGPMVMMPRALD